MPTSFSRKFRSLVYLVTFIYTTNFALTLYINSSFLGETISKERVSLLFSLASLVVMVLLSYTTRLYTRIGQHRATQLFLLANVVGASALAVATNQRAIVLLWIMFYASGILLRFDLDVYMEKISTDEETGRARGIFLTILNFAIFVSPFIAGRIVGDANNYQLVYFTAAGMATVTLLIASTSLKAIREVEYRTEKFSSTFKRMLQNSNLRNIFATTFLLEFFYSWMVIYNPLYLHEHIGFDWSTIGIILSIMLLPFVLVEYPLGRLADTRLGEKEILTAGLILQGITTASIAFISTPSIALFAGILFITRVGAAAVEIMNETHFFKHVAAEDTGLISLYRVTRPLAYIIGPLLGAGILTLVPFNFIYLILGLFMISGIFFSLQIVDTK